MKFVLNINNGTHPEEVRNTALRQSPIVAIHLNDNNPDAIGAIPSRFDQIYASVNLSIQAIQALPKHITTLSFKNKITQDRIKVITRTMNTVIACNSIKQIRVSDQDQNKLKLLETVTQQCYRELYKDSGFSIPTVSITGNIILLPKAPSLNERITSTTTPESSNPCLSKLLERINHMLKNKPEYSLIAHHLNEEAWLKLTDTERNCFKKPQIPDSLIPWIIAQKKLKTNIRSKDYTRIEPYLNAEHRNELDKNTQQFLFNGVFERAMLKNLAPKQPDHSELNAKPIAISNSELINDEEEDLTNSAIKSRECTFFPSISNKSESISDLRDWH